MPDYDLVLRNGTIYDGNGSEPIDGSIGIRDGKIAAVGELHDVDDFTGQESIDCHGMAIAPGFIDMHSHSDWVLPQPDHGKTLAPLLEQGITTLVAGNCGCTPAPLTQLNERLVPRLGRLLHDETLDYRWRDMGEFLSHLECQGLALNCAQLVGHGSLRAAVKGIDSSPADEQELAAMSDLARQALDQGAIGISTGLGYAPGIFADQRELIAVTAPLAERGGIYTSHARSYVALTTGRDDSADPSNVSALDETAAVFRAHGVKVQHSHLIFVGDTTWPTTDRALEHFESLIDEGVDIACDAFPYVGGNTTLIVFLPAWALANPRAAIQDPVKRDKLATSLQRMQHLFGMRWEDTQILWVPDSRYRSYEGQTIADIAKERGTDPTQTYLDLVAELGSETRIINWNYSGRDDEETSLRKVLLHSHTCFETDTILTGNGFDNPASYGTFPRLLGRYVRELGLLTLPEAIRRMTGYSAERMQLHDRGRIAEGLAADVVVFDPETIGDNTTRSAPNLAPSGIQSVIINGTPVVRGGKADPTLRAGAVLRP